MYKINKKYKYWEFYYDETNSNEESRQCVGSIWSDVWSGMDLLRYTEDELRDHLLADIEDKWRYERERVNKGLVRHAITELKKIKKELNYK